MSVDWISEARERHDATQVRHDRASQLTADLAAVWFREFIHEIEESVRELNRLYPERFGRELRSVQSAGLELRCGPNPVFEALLISDVILKVTRYKRVGSMGELRGTPDHYTARLDTTDSLFFESKDGRPVPCSNLGQELLAFLID
jgi:hypothetical protein